MHQISALLYTTNQYRSVALATDAETAESICHKLCKDIKVTPASSLLFALRLADSDTFVAPCRSLEPNAKYEFRMRFQVNDLSKLKRTDPAAFDYFYQQLKCDLIALRIRGLEYPNHTAKVAGLCVMMMYTEMLDKALSFDYLMANYKKYVPAKYVRKHSIFFKPCIKDKLKSLVAEGGTDANFLKSTVLETILAMAPDYLVEQCAASAEYPAEDDCRRNGATCDVRLTFDAYHKQTPGLIVKYPHHEQPRHVCRLDDIFAIVVQNDSVQFELRNTPSGFTVSFASIEERESFLSGICGYYRLTVKWTINLCADLRSPQLQMLTALKCHGPIGYELAYGKLEENRNIPGSYIVRQCERVFDDFYIDIIAKGTLTQTFKITNSYNMWHWHSHSRDVRSFNSLAELARGIPSDYQRKVLLTPSEFDKTPTLLLCLPNNEWTVKQSLNKVSESEMRLNKTQILNPATDLRKYILTAKLTDKGIISQMQAEWILPDNKVLDVTLKILTDNNYQKQFLTMVQTWSNLFAPELIKMYGFTLSSPLTFVVESIHMGPLDEFLRNANESVSTVCLIDAAYSLARALHYLQENHIVHGHIRCSMLHVVKFQSPNHLVVRLGDPGFSNGFAKEDVPWIPVEYSTRRDMLRLDFKADIWAFATTMWEIFSRGRVPTVHDFIQSMRRLPQPKECPRDVYNIMVEGWDPIPERRFSPQMIFSRLIGARDALRNVFESQANGHKCGSTTSVNVSEHSQSTEKTTLSFSGNGLDTVSTNSQCSTNSGNSSIIANDETSLPLAVGATAAADFPHSSSSVALIDLSNLLTPKPDRDFSQSILELPDKGKVVLQGQIGQGHYGVVYRGQLEDFDQKMTKVAVKAFKKESTLHEDFEREIEIMCKLDHPNIVRIIAHIHQPKSIIMEYVEHRSFLMYLNSKAPILTQRQLIMFSKDIARGMEYLGSMQILHRDLAARNVLVDQDECVKISDFGLAQETKSSDGYYVIQTLRDLPLKWNAPETLNVQKYSYMSDVWSYGVTLFEIFSRGCQPDLAPGLVLKTSEQLDRLVRGDRLPRPDMCPISVYETIMLPSWSYIARERPTFSRILLDLETCEAELSPNGI